MAVKNPSFLDKIFPYLLSIAGLVGLLASFILTLDKMELLKNPDFQPICSINPIFSCVSVMATPQAEVFGFPNMLLGLIGFSMVIVVGMAMFAGARFATWFWQLFNFGSLFGVIFIHWLFTQSVYSIEALCIYCMVVWAVTAPIFWYTLLYNLRHGHLPVPQSFKRCEQFAQRHHLDILFLWYVLIAGLTIQHFWFYFETLLP